jgi:DNA-binding transcriptional LysR family regulator
MVVSELLPFLRTGKLDFIIGANIPSEYLSGLVQEPIFNTAYAVYVRKGHPLVSCTSLAELQEADWFLPVTTMGHYDQLELLLFGPKTYQKKAIMWGTGTAALQMVMNADYLTIATKAMVRTHFLAQNLCTIPVKEALPNAEFFLIYSSERPLTLAARNLMDEFHRESQNYNWD